MDDITAIDLMQPSPPPPAPSEAAGPGPVDASGSGGGESSGYPESPLPYEPGMSVDLLA